MRLITKICFGVFAAPSVLYAQPAPPPPSVLPAALAAPPTIPAGTTVVLQIDSEVSSKVAKEGDWFPIHLAEDVLIDGRLALPANTPGQGQVVHAARKGLAGKAGELIIAARYLDHDGTRIPLGYLRWSQAGQDNTTGAVIATMIFTPAGFFVQGGDVTLQAGTQVTARTIRPPAPIAPPSAPALPSSASQETQP